MNRHSFLARVYHAAGLQTLASSEVMQLAADQDPWTAEDESTISVVTKVRVDQLRRARRTISIIEKQEESKGKSNRLSALRQFKTRIETSLTDLLVQYIDVIDKTFIGRATGDASHVLFLKMKADYSRYLAEMQRTTAAQVQASYIAAYDAARATLSPAHPLRSGIALNYAIFFNDIARNKEMAISIAKAAYDEGMGVAQGLPPEEKQNALEVLDLLAASLSNWG